MDARRFQFKAGGDESGVTDRLQGVEKWDQRLAGTVMVWRDENGKDWIADGHQRLGLATRLQADDPSIRMNAFVLDSADGITAGQARAYAAAKNIAEGSGTAIDAAKVIREAAADADVSMPPLPPRSALVRDGQAVARLGPEAFGMAVNEVIPIQQAAIVGRLVTDPAQQAEAIRLLAQYHPENMRQTESIVRELLATGTELRTQDGLFGPQDFASSVVLERAKIIDEATRQLGRDRTTFATLVNRADEIAGAGNQLATDTNRARLTTDERASAALQSLATTRGAVSDELSAIAREFKSGAITRADAGRRFLGVVRRGAEAGLERGDTTGGEGPGDEGSAGDVAFSPRRPPVPPKEGDDLFGVAAPARRTAATPEPTIRNDPAQTDMFGKGDAAVQAQAARDQAGRGGINPRGVVKPADEGLFAPDTSGQRPLFSPRPVADIRGDELGGEDVSAGYRRTRGREALLAVIKQGPIENKQLGTIQFSGSSVGRTLKDIDPAKLALIPHLRELIADGALVRSVLSYKPDQNVKAYHTLDAPVRIGGVDHAVSVVVREDNNGKFYYDFEKSEAPSVPRDVSPGRDQTLTQPASTEPLGGEMGDGQDSVNIGLDEGGADRSGKALPAAGTVDNSSERSAPDVDLNLSQLPGDGSGSAPDGDIARPEGSESPKGGVQFSPRPVADVRGDELGGEDMSAGYRRTRGREALLAVMKQGPVENPQLGTIQFSGASVGRTLKYFDSAKLALIPHLREIIAAGELVDTVRSYKPDANVKAYHNLLAPVRVGGVDYDARVVIREDNNGRFYYDFDKSETPPVTRGVSAGQDQTLTAPAGQEPPGGEMRDGQGDVNLDVNRPENDKGLPLFSPRREEERTPLYSALTRAVEGIKQEKATPGQWIATLKNMAGVKPEERAWTGLDEWLGKQPKSVTRGEVLDYLRANALDVREVTRGGDDRHAAMQAMESEIRALGIRGDLRHVSPLTVMNNGGSADLQDRWADAIYKSGTNAPKFGQYTLPGGKDYREMLITLPGKLTEAEAINRVLIDKYGGLSEAFREWTPQEQIAFDRAHAATTGGGRSDTDYHSSHWDEPNVLAHVRFAEHTAPDGAKVLLVEEVQSDWHQAGRKQGYKNDAAKPLDELFEVKRHVVNGETVWSAYDRETGQLAGRGTNLPDMEREVRQSMADDATPISRLDAVPSAPFKTTWPALAMKRMIQFAVDHGLPPPPPPLPPAAVLKPVRTPACVSVTVSEELPAAPAAATPPPL